MLQWLIVGGVASLAVLGASTQVQGQQQVFELEADVGGTVEQTWKLVSDVGNIATYHPHVEASRYAKDGPLAVGTRAVWVLPDNKGEVTEQVSALDAGRSITVDFIEGPLPVRSAVTRFTVSPAAGGLANVRIRLRFEMKGGWLGSVFGRWVVKPRLQQRMRDFLGGLDGHLRANVKGPACVLGP